MPSEIELCELLASGLQEPWAAWTEAAKRNVDTAIGDTLRPENAELLPYVPPANDPAAGRRHAQLLKLHDAVGASILLDQYGGYNQLPSKQDRFDLTFQSSNGLDRLGTVIGTLKDGELYLILFTGAAQHYYSKHKPAVDALFASIQI